MRSIAHNKGQGSGTPRTGPPQAAPTAACLPPCFAGAREGQRKNFEALRKVLAQHTRISEPPAAAEAAPAAAAAAEAAPVAQPAAVPAAEADLLETLAGGTAFRQLEPWAAWLHARLDAAAPVVAAFLDAQVLLALLCMAALLGALRLVVDMLLFVQHAAAQPRDTIGLLTHHLLRVSPGGARTGAEFHGTAGRQQGAWSRRQRGMLLCSLQPVPSPFAGGPCLTLMPWLINRPQLPSPAAGGRA